ncbi:MAG: PLP-dependent aminotransferase family protein, partial [Acidobacteriota bacterium]
SAMANALRRELPAGAAAWTDPEGGFFFWLDLQGRDSRRVFAAAVAAGVAFLPGPAFFPEAGETVGEPLDGAQFARLCFTFARPDQIDDGCRRLAVALKQA